jgi:hypothetical protein
VFCQTFGLFFARKEISMRDVAILVDGGFYLKCYKKQTDGKQVGSKVSILIKPSISLAFTLELGLLMATTVPMPYCLADFKTEGIKSVFI